MSDTTRKVDYYYVVVPDRPGECAKVLSALAVEGINLLAFSGFPSARKGQLDLVPEDSVAFKLAAKKLKLKLSRRKSGFLLQGDDRVGAMNETLGKLAGAKINITAMDAVSSGEGHYGAIFWVKPEAVSRAAKLLGAR
jgi:prephenate dehydratase